MGRTIIYSNTVYSLEILVVGYPDVLFEVLIDNLQTFQHLNSNMFVHTYIHVSYAYV